MTIRQSYEPASPGVVPTLADRLLYGLFPAPCLACAEPLWRPRETFGLCAGCERRLVPRVAGAHCVVCGHRLGGCAATPRLCSGCRRRRPSYRRLLWGWDYAEPFDQVVMALKFRRLDYLGSQLGRRLGRSLAPELGKVDCVVPVPLHWWRRWRRGYDQAELIAQAVAGEIGRPWLRLLRRSRATRPQSLRGLAERRQGLHGAFAAAFRAGEKTLGRHVLLVDDVATTGATLEAAASCLRAMGAVRVTALVAARTPAPGERPAEAAATAFDAAGRWQARREGVQCGENPSPASTHAGIRRD
jgi:ComF family protein